MWIWDQSNGELIRDGKTVAKGYSGRDLGKNNPKMQKAVGVGPIPEGDWSIRRVYDSMQTGKFTIEVAPYKTTNTFGRSAFRIHGDSIKQPGTASHGCIILSRITREEIWASGDRLLRVVE